MQGSCSTIQNKKMVNPLIIFRNKNPVCEFTNKKELLRDKIVLGTNDIETQEKQIKMVN